MVVVVSAMSGETNRLIALAKALQDNPDPREMDVILSTGEQVTIGLLCMALKEIGVDAVSYTGGQVKILTDDSHMKARILSIDDAPMRADLKAGRVVVVAGRVQVADARDAKRTLDNARPVAAVVGLHLVHHRVLVDR